MKDLEKDRVWRGSVEPYRFTEDETVALLEVTDFHQEYSYKNDDNTPYVTYYQREWRLPFSILPFAGSGESHEPGMSSFYIRDGGSYPIVKFGSSDVAFLVAPRAFRKAVSDLADGKGWEVKVFEDEVEQAQSLFQRALRRILWFLRPGRA
jgi:catechol 2,3-dioxygenase-like lactoylglutathione lyase family enzyme